MADGLTELRDLHHELSLLKRPLEGLLSRYKRGHRYKELQKEISKELDEIEDIIATHMNKHMAIKRESRFGRLLTATSLKENSIIIAQAVKEIRKVKLHELRKLLGRLSNVPEGKKDRELTEAIRQSRQEKTKHIVGFEEEAAHMINLLNSESSQLKVYSIVGMAGIGKTALAYKVFEDSSIIEKEFIRIWIDISDDYSKKNVCLSILKILKSSTAEAADQSTEKLIEKVKSSTAETADKSTGKLIEKVKSSTAEAADQSTEKLIEKVKACLKDGKFLIVMDDIWTLSVWDDIKCILPMDNKNSRVLITTRNKDVAVRAMDSKLDRVLIKTHHPDVATNASDEPYNLRFLTVTESWEIFQYAVYSELNVVPEELVVHGRVIAAKCCRHALSVVVIGDILKSNRDPENWKSAISSLSDSLFHGDNHNILSSISLSYKTLSFELRTCLLYLGVFSGDANIPVNKLLRLWIAEELIQEDVGKSLEVTALENLKVLINRNLVMVEETKFDGVPKSCRIHNSVREFCKEEAKYENLNLFIEIGKSPSKEFVPVKNIEKFRRLSIHSHVLDFLKTNNNNLSKVRSFLSFPSHPMILLTADMASVIDGFDLLRVYDAPNIKFQTFPRKFAQLLHLRYLILVLEQCVGSGSNPTHCTSLPDAISNLWNLQTLIIDVSSDTLEIKADIWEMRMLRHLKTKASITLKKGETGKGGSNLQTLSRLSPESFTREVVEKATNLVTLAIQGELNKIAAPNGLGELKCLLKLKLVNYVSNRVADEIPYPFLRKSIGHPPPCLKILVLSATYMDWKEMSILSNLTSLEVLKLKENAFCGNIWQALDIFPSLKRLHIETATELSTWETINDPFPNLKILVLYNCVRLRAVPSQLYEKLDLLCMERVTENAVSCAQEIHREKDGVFKLEIAIEDLNRKF